MRNDHEKMLHCEISSFRRGILMVAAGALLHAQGWATGGFEEEPLQTLSDYLRLDQLPAKSADQIRDETVKAAPKAAEVDFAGELMALTKKPGPEALASLDKMIAAARASANSAMLNLLHDVRDLFAG